MLEEDDLRGVNVIGNCVRPLCTWAVNVSIIERQNKSYLLSNNKPCVI